MAEKAGIRSVSLVATGFLGQAAAVGKALGLHDLAVAEYPGVPMVDSQEELYRKVEDVIVGNVIRALTAESGHVARPAEPGPKDIIFKGSLDEVNESFYEKMWAEGLPIIPPTVDRVESFLEFTDRAPDEVVAVLLPENREATVWSIAVNGVMAGCRPEYMPVLTAVVEAIAAPEFRLEDAGSTPGWEPIIILNGPIIKRLDFNCGSGVMRVGRRANTSIGRFLRLYMRNVAGLRIAPGATDKGSIAYTFNVVLAENEDAIAEIGWQPFSVDRGFKAGDNVVTVQSVVSITPPCYSGGQAAVDHLETMADIIGQSMAYRTATAVRAGQFHPLFVFSPSVATVIAEDGWRKEDVKLYLYENVKAPACFMEKRARDGGKTSF
ncbi:MAG: hypothetical protein ABIH46_10685, partial [Chloroflexota bacterium]